MGLDHERLDPEEGGESAAEHLHRYTFARELVTGLEVLDLACGEGYGSDLLAGTARRVLGMDVDAETIRRATEKYRHPNLEFREGSATDIPLAEASVDAIVSYETLEHLRVHDCILREMRRVLRPGGLLLISTPERRRYAEEALYHNPFHLHELTTEEFREALSHHFRSVQMLGQSTFYGSLIAPLEGTAPAPSHAPLYLLALCGDAPRPQPPCSIYDCAGDPLRLSEPARLVQLSATPRRPWWQRLFSRAPEFDCRFRSFAIALHGAAPAARAVRARCRAKTFAGTVTAGRYEVIANLGSGAHPVSIEAQGPDDAWREIALYRVAVPEVNFTARQL